MRILFHRQAAAGNKTGVGYYTSRLLEALAETPGTHQIDGFPHGWLWAGYRARAVLLPLWERWRFRYQRLSRRAWLGALAAAPRQVVRCLVSCGRALLQRQLQAMFHAGRYDLYHEPNFLPVPTDLPTIVTLHDLSVLLHPEWHPPQRVKAYDRGFRRGLLQARHFLTVSDTVRKQVVRLLNISPSRVTRVYNGIHPHLSPLPMDYTTAVLRRLQLRPGYLLYLGTIEPRKNVLMLLQAYCSLPPVLRTRCPLLLVGGWGWKFQEVADYYQNYAREKGVLHLGYVPERYLPVLYNGARALVAPSLDEGFGLPCVEMLACGGAVLASDVEVFRETVGGQAQLLPSQDADAWRTGMAEVIRDDDLHTLLRHGATQAALPYSWKASALQTLAVYRALAGTPSTLPLSRAA